MRAAQNSSSLPNFKRRQGFVQAAGQDHDEALADAMMVKVQDINLNQLDLNGSIFKA